jgi:hypothetical protein
MPEAERPPGDAYAPLSDDELRGAWDLFRTGAPVPCPHDGAPLALAVDASAGVYRFVCTGCGASSPWFESTPQGLRLRGTSHSGPAPAED